MVRQILFGSQSLELLRRGLDAGAARMKVFAENVANVGTPGYRARQLLFEELLSDARRGQLPLQRTHASHLGASAQSESGIAAHRVTDSKDPVPEGALNNVDLERELVQMQKNEIQFQALSQVLANKYRGLKDAIRPS